MKVLLVGTRRTCEKACLFKLGDNKLISFPVLDTKPLNNISFPNKAYEWILLTSPAAVLHFMQLTQKPQFEKVAVVGPSTKKAANKQGLKVDYVPKIYNAESFCEELQKSYPDIKSAVFPCSAEADNTIENSFRSTDIPLDRINLYKLVTLEKKDLPEFEAVAFFSGSSVKAFFKIYGKPEAKKIAAIGKKAAKSVKEYFGIEPLVPDKSTTQDTIQILL